jgi:hypothetical protein
VDQDSLSEAHETIQNLLSGMHGWERKYRELAGKYVRAQAENAALMEMVDDFNAAVKKAFSRFP